MRRIEGLQLAFIEWVGDVGLMGTYRDLWRLVVTGWE